MWSGIFFKITEKYFPPEVTLMMVGLALFSMLVAKDAYVFILILLGIAGSMYIVFTNKKYKKHKALLEEIFDKYF
jgi:positive regulator of sigma E activity